jgi:hypothetical protein
VETTSFELALTEKRRKGVFAETSYQVYAHVNPRKSRSADHAENNWASSPSPSLPGLSAKPRSAVQRPRLFKVDAINGQRIVDAVAQPRMATVPILKLEMPLILAGFTYWLFIGE